MIYFTKNKIEHQYKLWTSKFSGNRKTKFQFLSIKLGEPFNFRWILCARLIKVVTGLNDCTVIGFSTIYIVLSHLIYRVPQKTRTGHKLVLRDIELNFTPYFFCILWLYFISFIYYIKCSICSQF